MDALKTYDLSDGRKLEIYHDEDAESPRVWDNMGMMVCFHRRYNLGDSKTDHGYDMDVYNSWEHLKGAIVRDNPDCVILPLYLYDHSGITISTAPFNCPWDSGQVGFIFLEREKIDKYFKGNDEKAKDGLMSEVKLYDMYLRGNTYGFVVRDTECEHCGGPGKELDSCWGFYGSSFVENGMLDSIPDLSEDDVTMLEKEG